MKKKIYTLLMILIILIPFFNIQKVSAQEFIQNDIAISLNTQKEWDIKENIKAYIFIYDKVTLQWIDAEVVVTIYDEVSSYPIATFLKQDLEFDNITKVYTITLNPISISGYFIIGVEASYNGKYASETKTINLGLWKDALVKASASFVPLYNSLTSFETNIDGNLKFSRLRMLRTIDIMQDSLDLDTTENGIEQYLNASYKVFIVDIPSIPTTIHNKTEKITQINQVIKYLNNSFDIKIQKYTVNTIEKFDRLLANNWTENEEVNISTKNAIIFNMHGEYIPTSSLYNNKTLVIQYLIIILISILSFRLHFAFFGIPFNRIAYTNGTTLEPNALSSITNKANGWVFMREALNLPYSDVKKNSIGYLKSINPATRRVTDLNVSVNEYMPNELTGFTINPEIARTFNPLYIDSRLISPIGIIETNFIVMGVSFLNSTNEGELLGALVLSSITEMYYKLYTTTKEKLYSIKGNIVIDFPSSIQYIDAIINNYTSFWNSKTLIPMINELNVTRLFLNNTIKPILYDSIKILNESIDDYGRTVVNISYISDAVRNLGYPAGSGMVLVPELYLLLQEMYASSSASATAAAAAPKYGDIGMVIIGIALMVGIWIGLSTIIANIVETARGTFLGICKTINDSLWNVFYEVNATATGIVAGAKKALGDAISRASQAAYSAKTRLDVIWDSVIDKTYRNIEEMYNYIEFGLIRPLKDKFYSNIQIISFQLGQLESKFEDIRSVIVPQIITTIEQTNEQLRNIQSVMFSYVKTGFTEMEGQLNVLKNEMSLLRSHFNEILTYIFKTITFTPLYTKIGNTLSRVWSRLTASEIQTAIQNFTTTVDRDQDYFSRSEKMLPYITNTFSETRSISSSAAKQFQYALDSYGKISTIFYKIPDIFRPLEEERMADTSHRTTITPTTVVKDGYFFIYTKNDTLPYDPSSIEVSINSQFFSINKTAMKVDIGVYKVNVTDIDEGRYIVSLLIDENNSVSEILDIKVPGLAQEVLGISVLSLILISILVASGISVMILYIYIKRKYPQ